MKINAILDHIDTGNYALPVFQRGYVWSRDQVRRLMDSLYKGYPIGSILIWDTKVSEEGVVRGDDSISGNVKLILDGQQRITSLYGLIRGEAPSFFEGDTRAFTDLYFNVETDTFEFYGSMKMGNNPAWINVTDLLKQGAGNYVQERPELINRLSKLNAIDGIKTFDLPIIEVTGEDKNIDVVVEIFNQVNSAGTTLSKGDLALAKLSASWPKTREKLNGVLSHFEERGFRFSRDWLLRCITVYLTSQPYFSGLENVNINDFKESIDTVKGMIGSILDQIGSRLGLDHDQVIKGRFAFVTIIQLMKDGGGEISDYHQWNKIMYWYIHTFLWGRYSASTESALAQDLTILREGKGIDGLISQLRKNRGSLEIRPEDFLNWSRGARFYPLLYLMTRVNNTIDWVTGVELKQGLLGKNSSLELHHVFPKSLLYDAGYDRIEVNTLANYTFLTKGTNLKISNENPKEYLPKIRDEYPGALEGHWIPMDETNWNISNYLEFVSERRALLADAANNFLNTLYNSDAAGIINVTEYTVEEGVLSEEDEIILKLSYWMEEKGLDGGEIDYEITDEEGKELAIFNLAWPQGIQVGLSKPIAFLVDQPQQVFDIANRSGFTYFINFEDFKTHVEENYL